MKIFMLLFLFLSLFTLCQGQESSDDYPYIRNASTFTGSAALKTYDYIVIGGGTSGCAIAATLVEKYSVLVLERGNSPIGNANVTLLSNYHINWADQSPTSPAQYFLADGVYNMRAKILGGGTSINAGFYSRASPSSISDMGLDPQLVSESYPWIEEKIVFEPEPLNTWQRAYKDGLLEIGITPDNGYTFEHLNGTKTSGSIFDKFGIRHTSVELLQSANPDLLDVLVHATVQKIVFRNSLIGNPKADGVIFNDENGNRHVAMLSISGSSEVILSAGTIGSPQLLLLSGIGPKSQLESMNISVVSENEFVGQGMADNPLSIVMVPWEKMLPLSLIQTVGIPSEGVYIETLGGFGQGPTSIDYTVDPPREAYQGAMIISKLSHPRSTGSLSLNNTNVDDMPNVSFNYFSDPQDLQDCVNGIKILEGVSSTTHLQNYIQAGNNTFEQLINISVALNVGNIIDKTPDVTTNMSQFCRQTQVTIWHYHGGCLKGTVINDDYEVLGVRGLRVVDSSTFVHSPGTNPQATVLMIGRYVGVKILRGRSGRAAE